MAEPTSTATQEVQEPGTEAVPSPQVTGSPLPSISTDPDFVDNADCQNISRTQLPLADVTIRDGTRRAAFAAEMAVTPAEKSQGLMCRETVPTGTGMLFIWNEERTGGFWMFNTYAPLDIIFFGARDGSAAFKQMEPCPRGDRESDTAWNGRCGQESADYRHGISYTTALELPQGWLGSLGFDTANPQGIEVSFTARRS